MTKVSTTEFNREILTDNPSYTGDAWGSRFDEETLSRLFDEFYQAEHAFGESFSPDLNQLADDFEAELGDAEHSQKFVFDLEEEGVMTVVYAGMDTKISLAPILESLLPEEIVPLLTIPNRLLSTSEARNFVINLIEGLPGIELHGAAAFVISDNSCAEIYESSKMLWSTLASMLALNTHAELDNFLKVAIHRGTGLVDRDSLKGAIEIRLQILNSNQTDGYVPTEVYLSSKMLEILAGDSDSEGVLNNLIMTSKNRADQTQDGNLGLDAKKRSIRTLTDLLEPKEKDTITTEELYIRTRLSA